MQAWRLSGLDPARFRPLFDMPDDDLQRLGAARRTATATPGFPCRVSLEDANLGEVVLLLPPVHHDAASPYRASGPIFVRRCAARAELAPGQVPPCVTGRLISVRAYDDDAMMTTASVCEGTAVAAELDRLFADRAIAYVQLRNARQGCFSCHVGRAQ